MARSGGIAEMRVLIRSIAAQGKAVIVSSHQLSEIEQVCDDITIISRGHLVVSGTLQDVRSTYKGRQGVIVHIDGRSTLDGRARTSRTGVSASASARSVRC
ncbi:MAG: hypothetical protein R2706_20255 [Acidimicrobiales bacterium]